MKFSMSLLTDKVELGDEFVSGPAVMEIAKAAEDAGFDAVAVTEHPFPEDAWMATGGHHALDPYVALSFAAAATSTLGLHTNLCVLPYRNPFVTAKAVVSLDQLSGGRLIFGTGAGYLEPEFNALGVPFDERNDLMDEAIVAMKRAWSEDGVHLDGRHFAVRGHTMRPRPAQTPHPPIWIGGNSKRAIRRAVELGDGWSPFPNPSSSAARRHTPAMQSLDDLKAGIDHAHALAEKVGRTEPLTFVFAPLVGGTYRTKMFDVDAYVAHMVELEALGVSWVVSGFPVHTRAEQRSAIDGFATEVLPLVRAATRRS